MKNFKFLTALLLFSTASVVADTETCLQRDIANALIAKILAEREVAKNCTDKHLADWHNHAYFIIRSPRFTTDIPDQSPEFKACGSSLFNLTFAEIAEHKAQAKLTEHIQKTILDRHNLFNS